MKSEMAVTRVMKSVLLLFLPICLLLQSPVATHANPSGEGNFKLGIAFMIGFPKNEFSDNVENNGYGVNFNFGYTIPQSPLTIGLDAGFLIYGRETRRERFSLTIPDVTVEVTRSNNIVPIHLYMRLSPPSGPVLPYAEGLIGLSYLFTETSIKDEDEFDEEIASSKNLEDVAFNYGGGGGLLIQVYKREEDRRSRREDDDNKLHSVYINLSLRYMKGGEAEYLTEGSIEIEGGNVFYDVRQSRTDMVMAKIGVTFAF